MREIGKDKLYYPCGLALRNVGNRQTVLVAELDHAHRVTEWGVNVEDGNDVLCTFGTCERGGNGNSELFHPCDVAVLSSNKIAIADTGNHRICIIDGESGSFVRVFGSKGTVKDGNFSFPCAIAADAYGHLLVLDRCTHRLQVFDTNGTHLCTRTNFFIRDGYKGLEWWGEGDRGRLAIGNSTQNSTLIFDWGYM